MNVLVPFDLTAASEHALDHAVTAFGARADATIHAVHFGTRPEQVEQLARESVTEASTDVAATVETRFVDADRDRLDDREFVAGGILTEADALDTGVIIVGHHEQSRLESFLNRSVADHLIDDGSYPVTVVP